MLYSTLRIACYIVISWYSFKCSTKAILNVQCSCSSQFILISTTTTTTCSIFLKKIEKKTDCTKKCSNSFCTQNETIQKRRKEENKIVRTTHNYTDEPVKRHKCALFIETSNRMCSNSITQFSKQKDHCRCSVVVATAAVVDITTVSSLRILIIPIYIHSLSYKMVSILLGTYWISIN